MPQTMKDKILDAAEKRVRGAGFSAMSFRDLASDVGIKSASVHYHFPTKPDSYVALYSQALVLDETICLCAIMGAEAIGLPKNVNQKTKAFFKMNRLWLLDLFHRNGVENPEDTSCLIVAALEGGMIVASSSDDRAMFDQIAKAAIRSIAKI